VLEQLVACTLVGGGVPHGLGYLHFLCIGLTFKGVAIESKSVCNIQYVIVLHHLLVLVFSLSNARNSRFVRLLEICKPILYALKILGL